MCSVLNLEIRDVLFGGAIETDAGEGGMTYSGYECP
jgi:hypothetical protein